MVFLHILHSMSSGGKYSGTGIKPDLDNHGNQCNPNHEEYKGHQKGYSGTGSKADLDNHADQLNPNNPKYTSQREATEEAELAQMQRTLILVNWARKHFLCS